MWPSGYKASIISTFVDGGNGHGDGVGYKASIISTFVDVGGVRAAV